MIETIGTALTLILLVVAVVVAVGVSSCDGPEWPTDPGPCPPCETPPWSTVLSVERNTYIATVGPDSVLVIELTAGPLHVKLRQAALQRWAAETGSTTIDDGEVEVTPP